jgi:GxxExxY protein
MNELHLTTEVTESTETKKANDLTEIVICCAIEVHRAPGPGLFESAYEICLCRELTLRGIPFERQIAISVEYKGVKLDCGYRVDLTVGVRFSLKSKR